MATTNVHEKIRPPLSADAQTLPAWYYTDPDRYRDELERIFSLGWFHAGRADEVPSRGDYVLREIGDESVILVRDDLGEVRAHYNVCTHRGTRLCERNEGTFASTIQCPYHAWTFDLAGRLVGAPHMRETEGFVAEEHPLRSPAVGLWEGHVFLSFADRPSPPPAQRLADLSSKFRGWGMGRLARGKRIVYDVAANWKLIVQNYSECLHCPGVHPQLQKYTHYLSGENEPERPEYLGGSMDLRDGIGTLTLDGTLRRACLNGLNAEERRRVYYYAVLPNLLLSLHPDYMMTHTLWPRAVDRTEVVCEFHFEPDELAKPGFDPDDAAEFWDLTNRQDWHLCEQMQLGLKSRAYRPGPYSNREDLLHAFDRIVLGLMGDPTILNQ